MPPALIIPPNSRYGAWTILEEIGPDRRGNRQFICQCTCGTKSIVLLMNLRRGTSKGCPKCCSKRGVKGRPKLSGRKLRARQVKRNRKYKSLEDAGIL